MMHQCKKSPAYVHNKKQKLISFDFGGTLEVKAYNFDAAKLALIKMIVKDELPFSFVDGEGFQTYTHALQSQFNHKGKILGTLVERCLYDWGIERVYTVVVDNASSNQVALENIMERIGSWGSLVLGGTFLHVRWYRHVLNLIVMDGMEELDDSIEAIRNAMKYIRSSPSRLEKFRVAAQMAKVEHKGGVVPMDVCTRWNSTYFMLDIAVKYNKAFSKLEDEDQLYDAYFQDKIGGKKRFGPPKKED
ncbi:hypothetical protein QQ045_002940 [Rhodiola kirilowii]